MITLQFNIQQFSIVGNLFWFIYPIRPSTNGEHENSQRIHIIVKWGKCLGQSSDMSYSVCHNQGRWSNLVNPYPDKLQLMCFYGLHLLLLSIQLSVPRCFNCGKQFVLRSGLTWAHKSHDCKKFDACLPLMVDKIYYQVHTICK